MIYKTVSIKNIFSMVSGIVKEAYQGWQADAVEWTGDALEHIGYYNAFVVKPITLEVNNHRTVMPNDLFSINGVFYDDIQIPYGASNINSDYYNGLYFQSMPQGLSLDAINENLGEISIGQIPATLKQINPLGYSGEYYFVQPGYIITSFESGNLTVLYTAFDRDKEGLPKVPDEVNTRTALMWYIIANMVLTGYQHPTINYQFAYSMWEKYLTQAQNSLAMPSPEKFKSFAKKWVSMANSIEDSFDNNVNHYRNEIN